MTKRPGTMSDDERATVGAAHRRSPALGVPVKVEPEKTDQCETPEELFTMRAKRITKLEVGHAQLVKEVSETKVLALETRGIAQAVDAKTDGQTKLIEAIQTSVDRIAKRDDLTFESKVTVRQATQLDDLDAKKTRRTVIAKAAVALASGGALLKLVEWIAGRL